MESQQQIVCSSDNRDPGFPPFIVACGHRRIHIPKTGNTFPAVLVCLPATRHHPDGDGDKASPAATATTSVAPSLVWRSKRDFLLLSRSPKGQQQPKPKPPPIIFPKAAFKRLVEEDCVPWIRPSDSLPGNRNIDTATCQTCSSTQEQIASFRESGSDKPNNYDVKMKKSILHLDSFLQSVWKQSDSTAWDIFCRPHDTADLVDTNTCVPKTIQNDNAQIQQSCRLGQYFASSENAKQVVNLALDRLVALSKPNSHFLFIEPSCGHGDIVVALVQELKERDISPDRVTIRGYDIDGTAIEKCEHRDELFPSNCDYASCIQWRHQNFLDTQRELLVENTTKRVLTCCLGGPPYTSGAGSSSAIQRDLPTLFLHHCQDEWQADTITFLLPARHRNQQLHDVDDPFYENPWEIETFDLSSSTFLFRGTEQVIQPSIIQTYIRKVKE